MQTFTPIEMGWIIMELEKNNRMYKGVIKEGLATALEMSLLKLKTDQLSSVIEKLNKTLEEKSKIIKIKN